MRNSFTPWLALSCAWLAAVSQAWPLLLGCKTQLQIDGREIHGSPPRLDQSNRIFVTRNDEGKTVVTSGDSYYPGEEFFVTIISIDSPDYYSPAGSAQFRASNGARYDRGWLDMILGASCVSMGEVETQLLKTTSAAGTLQIWAGRASGRNTIAVTEKFELRDSTWISDDDPTVWVPPEYRQHGKMKQPSSRSSSVSSSLDTGTLISGAAIGFVIASAVGFGLVLRRSSSGRRVQLRRTTVNPSAKASTTGAARSAGVGGGAVGGGETGARVGGAQADESHSRISPRSPASAVPTLSAVVVQQPAAAAVHRAPDAKQGSDAGPQCQPSRGVHDSIALNGIVSR